jgi:Mrp family chromosome partitioning ATPase
VNRFEAISSVAPESSVAFIPAETAPAPAGAGLALVDRMVQAIGRPLEELARRTRRVGPADQGAVVLLTGCRRGIGCTTVSLALATAAARDQAVLLIDGDLVERGLSVQLGLPAGFGWEDALADRCTLDEALHPAGPQAGWPVLPLRQTTPDPSDLLSHPVLAVWPTQLRRDYDLVFIDGGSVWDGGAAWAALADVVLMVCDSGQQLADDWAHGWDRLEESGAYVLGIVETLT